MSQDVYTVPEQVLFRNFEVLSQDSVQTRSLLLQNKSNKPLRAFVSYPFTHHFGLCVNSDSVDGELCSTLEVHPGVPCKVTLELRVPEDNTLNYVQDKLVVCIGPTVLIVPIKAVRQSLDPAGGSQLQAIINELPFWPSSEDLDIAAVQYLQKLNQQYGLQLQTPEVLQQQLPNATPTGPAAAAATAVSADTHQPELQSDGQQPKTSMTSAIPTSACGAQQPASSASTISRAGSTPTALPPETFSVEAEAACSMHDQFEGLDDLVIRRPVVVQGRAAVATSGTSSTTTTRSATTAAVSTAVSMQGPFMPSTGSRPASGQQDPPSQPNLTSSSHGSDGAVAQAAGYAFALGGRYFDSRGRDVTAALASSGASNWTVVNCQGNGQAQRLDSTGESAGTTTQTCSSTLSSGTLKQGFPDRAQDQQAMMSLSKPQAGMPLGSGSTTITTHVALPSPQQQQQQEEDPARGAALAAAMRELGLSSLPPRPGSSGAPTPSRPPIDMRLRPRSGSFGRPSGGSRGKQSGEGTDSDLEDDFEARLQRNIELAMPAGCGSSSKAPGTPPMAASRSQQLAPLARRLKPNADKGDTKGGGSRPADAESQRGYGDVDDLDVQLQRQIDSQLSQGTSTGTQPTMKAPWDGSKGKRGAAHGASARLPGAIQGPKPAGSGASRQLSALATAGMQGAAIGRCSAPGQEAALGSPAGSTGSSSSSIRSTFVPRSGTVAACCCCCSWWWLPCRLQTSSCQSTTAWL